MSMKLMVDAMRAKVGHSGRKLVLIKLADNANDQGVCWPSYQYIADECEMGRSTVKEHIKVLSEQGFISVETRNDGKSSNQYRLHIEKGKKATRSESDPVKNKPGQKSDPTRSESDPHPVRNQPSPGQNLTPEPVTESITEPVNEPDTRPGKIPDAHPEDIRLAEFIFAGVVDAAPKTKPPNMPKWANTIRLMRERDKHSRREIAEVFGWANKNTFWRLNILSPDALRDKFARLSAAMEAEHADGNSHSGRAGSSVTEQSTVGRANAAAERKRQQIYAKHGHGPGTGDGGSLEQDGGVVRGEVVAPIRRHG